MTRSSEKRGTNLLVNIAILVTLGIVLFNPSGIVGRRITAVYDGWKNQRAITRVWSTLSDGSSRLVGHGLVAERTVIEFIDYECPSCRKIAGQVSQAVSLGEAEVVIRHLPLTRIHPSAESAARAAICSERHGLFAEAHASLLRKPDWREDTDWAGWATSIGIEDTASFEKCLSAESTSDRIEEDGRLADLVGVTGTPTFVTATGVFPGELGFGSALLNAETRGTATRRDTVPRVIDLSAPLFDSGEHPDSVVSTLGFLAQGAFVSDRRVVLLDDQRLIFFDLNGESVWTAGGGGDGPGEFRAPGGGLNWFPKGNRLVVWDPLHQRVSIFSDTGELVNNERVDVSPGDLESLLALFSVKGVLSDGGLVVVDYPGGVPDSRGIPEGYRQAERVVVISGAGTSAIVDSRGDEPSTVLFGARSFVAVTGDRVMVVDTEADAIEAYTRAGERLFTIPMPGERVHVGEEHLEAALDEARVRNEQRVERRARLLGRAGLGPAQRTRGSEVEFRHRDEAPPIDAMRADGEGRLWIRLHVMPGDDLQRWRVWEGRDELFRVDIPKGMQFMDARGDLILLRVEDAFGVPRALVVRMVGSQVVS